MVDNEQQIESSIELFEKDNTSDALIYSFLKLIENESIGSQNSLLERLSKKLEYYGKSDLKRMLKNVLNLSKEDEEPEPKIYLQIAERVLEEFRIITLDDSHQLMTYNSGCYSFNHPELDCYISEWIKRFNAPHRYTYEEVIDYIKKNTLYPRSKLNYDPNVIVFKNGMFDLLQNKFYNESEHERGAWHYFFEIPHKYKEGNYRCPKFKNLLRQWLSLPFSKARVQDIFEAIGLCMTINISFKSAFMNYGEAHTGKTQFFNIVKYIIGELNLSASSLQRISKNEFGTLSLQFKLLNYCSDLGSRRIRDTSIFKNITGGDDLIWAEIKGGKSFGFKPTAKFWFNANKIPAIEDIDDDAFFERFVMFLFGNVFTKENNKNFELDYYKLITEDDDEIQGIMHEAIKGFLRLQKRKGFRTKLRENTKHVWNYESNQIYAYIYDYCVIDRDEYILSEELYSHYIKKCRGVAQTKNIFTKGLQVRGIVKKPMTKKNEAGKRPECYYGVQLKGYQKKEELVDNLDIEEIITNKKTIIDDYNKVDYSDVGRF